MPKKVKRGVEFKSRFIKLGLGVWVDLKDITKVTPAHGTNGVQLNIQRKGEGMFHYKGPLVDDVHRALKKEGF